MRVDTMGILSMAQPGHCAANPSTPRCPSFWATYNRAPFWPSLLNPMCGIFLVLERGAPVNDARAVAATASLRHRGPDGTGVHRFQQRLAGPDGDVLVSGFLGHTRLSVLDPQARSDQPMTRRDRSLVYNGEIYNFRQLRTELAHRGSVFSTEGDTEVLLELLATQGPQGLNRAHGMWAFCLLDEAAGTLLAARDRYGKKPLFYVHDANRLCIASEIAPILHYLGQRPQMVPSQLETFLRHGWLFPRAGGASHIHGIHQVGAGAAMSFDMARWTMLDEAYFSLDDYALGRLPDADELAENISQAVLERLVADRRVGLLLSGGIDSSLILAVLRARKLDSQVTCFTGDAGKSEDARYAQACVEQLGIAHVSVPLDYGSAGLEGFLAVCKHQEKPFPLIGNALAMPQLYAQIASHDVPVVLDGTGGDEIFGGYWDRQHGFAMAEAQAAGDQEWLDEALRGNENNPKFQVLVRGDQPVGMLTSGRPLASAGIVGSPNDPDDLGAFVDPSVGSAASSDPLDGFTGTLGQAMALDASGGRLHEWLWQNDRNAMMSGIENRSPLLDHRLAPFMHSGYRNKFSGPWNKLELRRLFPSFVELPTQWRKDKQGFRWVYGRFLRHNKAQVLELIEASRLLPQRVSVGPLLDLARRDARYLECSLLQRMLCLAGLEQEMGLSSVT
jgi:asparagine synthase (glutamine-hydrolysing)